MIENIKKKQVRGDTYILNRVINHLNKNFHLVNNDQTLYNIWWFIRQSRQAKHKDTKASKPMQIGFNQPHYSLKLLLNFCKMFSQTVC